VSCDDKDGGTHHHACDCREAYFEGLKSELLKRAQLHDRLLLQLKRMEEHSRKTLDMVFEILNGNKP
jgi:hypothetical protein